LDIGHDDGERKQVTVLFADVMGSMDLAEQQDPEEWRKIMQDFFGLLAGAVTRFEGTVDKFTGDGIMAIFGAPVAHEDHARRAGYAALQMLDDVGEYAAELRRTHGLNFSIRVGINSGEVVAGAIGGSEEGEYTAIGHTVGLAQRMEALAEPGRAYLTGSTAELAGGFLELEELGEFEIKGVSHPVDVFELLGVGTARTRLDLSRARGLSRFVGRDRELARLEAAFERARAGEGSVSGIVAEAGIGKSRLCHEFAERRRAEGVEVYEAQGQAHGRGTPYMPVLQMLRGYFGIGDREDDRTVRERIAGRMLLLDPDFAQDLPILFDFLGVPDPDRPAPQMSAEARQRALGMIVCRLVNAPERRNTVVILVEDLHWLDEGSETMLRGLLDALADTNTHAVVNFRPEYSVPWDGDVAYEQIALEPLGPDDTRELLRDLAGEDPSLDGLDEAIHERTAGNPFFIEEIVRDLAESGFLVGERGAYRLARPVEEAGVPVSVQTVLSARIDRLSPQAKRLLQIASVIGKEVSERALALTAGLEQEPGPPLGELISAGFLYEAELYPERILAFRHPLTRDVAYSSQLAERRAATHAAAARAIIELEPERGDELAALVANHFEVAGEPLEAARWSARAAYWAGHSHPRDSLRLWRKAMELVEGLEEDDETRALATASRLMQLQYAWRLGMDRDEEHRLADEAERLATRSGDLHSLAMLKMATQVRPGIANDTDEWLEAVRETNRIADESGDLHLRVGLRAPGSWAYMCAGDFAGFEAAVDEMLELIGDDSGVGSGLVLGSPVAWGLMAKGMVRREQNQLDQAEELFAAALRVAEEEGDPETASWIRSNQGPLLAIRGDYAGAMALARRNCELTERLGDVFSRTLALANLGWTQTAAGEYEAAVASLESAERIYREAMGDSGGEMGPWRAALRANALVGAGRVEEAIELSREAVEEARKRKLLWSLPGALLNLSRARRAAGRPGGREALEEAIEIAREKQAVTVLLELESELAELEGEPAASA
jgi:adenylate cyclase